MLFHLEIKKMFKPKIDNESELEQKTLRINFLILPHKIYKF